MNSKNYAQKKLDKINVETIFEKQANDLINSLTKELENIKEINSVVLFGSFARGDYSLRDSDIDIMIFFDEEREDKKLEEKILHKVIKLNLNKDITIHTLFQYKKLDDEDRSLMMTISQEGKVLFSRKSIMISKNILGLEEYHLVYIDTSNTGQVTKNKVQRFLYGYKTKNKKYYGIIDEEKVFSAGRSSLLVPKTLLRKLLLFLKEVGVKAIQKGKFYR